MVRNIFIIFRTLHGGSPTGDVTGDFLFSILTW